MTAKEQAQTILEQLGGGKFIAMTGARSLTRDDNGTLTFRLPKNSTPINYVKIEINGLDLYDVEFHAFSLRRGVVKDRVISKHDGIYADMLRGVFERETGLRTSLTAVYA